MESDEGAPKALSGGQFEFEIDFFLAPGYIANGLLQLNTVNTSGIQIVERASRARALDIVWLRESAGGGPTQCEQARRVFLLNYMKILYQFVQFNGGQLHTGSIAQ